MNRHEAREKSFQILFQMDINDASPKQAMEEYLETREIDQFIQTLVIGVNSYKQPIDDVIKSQLEHWTIDRIALVEKTILRIAVFEIKNIEDIPINVSINEAVELGHKFGDDGSGKFINGVLSKIID